MPKLVSIAEMPQTVRVMVPQWVELTEFLRQQFKQAQANDWKSEEGVAFDESDGVTKDTQQAIANGLRNMANKEFGRRLNCIYKAEENILWVRDAGEFVPMTDEEKAARKASREANEAAKRQEQEEADTAAQEARTAQNASDAAAVQTAQKEAESKPQARGKAKAS